jgi:hypothetical protein
MRFQEIRTRSATVRLSDQPEVTVFEYILCWFRFFIVADLCGCLCWRAILASNRTAKYLVGQPAIDNEIMLNVW